MNKKYVIPEFEAIELKLPHDILGNSIEQWGNDGGGQIGGGNASDLDDLG